MIIRKVFPHFWLTDQCVNFNEAPLRVRNLTSIHCTPLPRSTDNPWVSPKGPLIYQFSVHLLTSLPLYLKPASLALVGLCLWLCPRYKKAIIIYGYTWVVKIIKAVSFIMSSRRYLNNSSPHVVARSLHSLHPLSAASLVRYCSWHLKIKSISPRHRVISSVYTCNILCLYM